MEYVKIQIRESIAKYPREYVFSDLNNKNKSMNEKVFKKMLEYIIEPYCGKKMASQLIRKIYITNLLGKEDSGKVIRGNYSVYNIEEIGKRMDISDAITFETYRIFYNYDGTRIKEI